MNVKILIVEDELIIAEDMRDILEDLGYEVVGVTGDAEEAKRILSATSPDLVMVDITLGTEQLGLALAMEITEKFKTPFIFCTSHADPVTISKATKLHPSGYLVKPFDQKGLFSAIEVALANFAKNRIPATIENNEESAKFSNIIIKDALFIKEGHLYVKVMINEIRWLNPDGNYTTIHQKEGKKHLVRMPLKDLHEQLPRDKFFRTHRSYVVNLDYIEAINNQTIYIEDQPIPLGKSFREELLMQIKKMQ